MVEQMPEYMGYDRTIAVFSPDGRLFQVEYAKEAVKRGSTTVGITFKDGVVLASTKLDGDMMVSSSAEKIFEIDSHIVAAASGLLADARILVQQARVKSQIHKITYEEPVDAWNVAHIIGDKMQISTLYAGLRPYGVSFLLGGVDSTGPHLIESDPSGMLYEWRTAAIGRGSHVANKILKQKWKTNMKEEDAIKLAVEVMQKSEKDRKQIDIAVVKTGETFKRLDPDQLKKMKN